MTQTQLSADPHFNQAAVAKLERRTGMYLSTLGPVAAKMCKVAI